MSSLLSVSALVLCAFFLVMTLAESAKIQTEPIDTNDSQSVLVGEAVRDGARIAQDGAYDTEAAATGSFRSTCWFGGVGIGGINLGTDTACAIKCATAHCKAGGWCASGVCNCRSDKVRCCTAVNPECHRNGKCVRCW